MNGSVQTGLLVPYAFTEVHSRKQTASSEGYFGVAPMSHRNSFFGRRLNVINKTSYKANPVISVTTKATIAKPRSAPAHL